MLSSLQAFKNPSNHSFAELTNLVPTKAITYVVTAWFQGVTSEKYWEPLTLEQISISLYPLKQWSFETAVLQATLNFGVVFKFDYSHVYQHELSVYLKLRQTYIFPYPALTCLLQFIFLVFCWHHSSHLNVVWANGRSMRF